MDCDIFADRDDLYIGKSQTYYINRTNINTLCLSGGKTLYNQSEASTVTWVTDTHEDKTPSIPESAKY